MLSLVFNLDIAFNLIRDANRRCHESKPEFLA